MNKRQQNFTAKGDTSSPAGTAASDQRKKRITRTTILSLDHDILGFIFTFLSTSDLVSCSLVCKSWNAVFQTCSLREHLRRMLMGISNFGFIVSSSEIPETPPGEILRGVAMLHHRIAVQRGIFHVDQWKGHSAAVAQCRMKMGTFATGVGDKVIRLWSLDSRNYNCIEEYSIPAEFPLSDFDFDESKIVGLTGNRLCIWRRNGKRSLFPSLEGTSVKASCMRYFDPGAMVGYDDGAVRVFDMYSRRCSQIIRMHSAPVTCLCVDEDQLILSGSTSGSIALSDADSVQKVATLSSRGERGIMALSFNPSSKLVFAGSATGYTYCWDLRTMKQLWSRRVSYNAIHSLEHMRGDTTLAVGGIDGILRFLDQDDGSIVSRCIMDDKVLFPGRSAIFERRRGKRLPEGRINIGHIPLASRPCITCVAVARKKIVTTHNSSDISFWDFS